MVLEKNCRQYRKGSVSQVGAETPKKSRNSKVFEAGDKASIRGQLGARAGDPGRANGANIPSDPHACHSCKRDRFADHSPRPGATSL